MCNIHIDTVSLERYTGNSYMFFFSKRGPWEIKIEKGLFFMPAPFAVSYTRFINSLALKYFKN